MRTQEDNEFLAMMQQTPALPQAQEAIDPGEKAK